MIDYELKKNFKRPSIQLQHGGYYYNLGSKLGR